jgi:NitT/TauT family transport system substrate-binding protein
MRLARSRVIALLAGAAVVRAPRVSAQPARLIRIAAAPSDSYAEAYYALDGGFFARAGLNVDVTTLPNGAAIAQAMAGNAVDVGIGDIVNVANVVNAGLPLAFFAGSGIYQSSAPTTLLVVAKNSPVTSAKELEGLPLAVAALASMSSLGVRSWLQQNGADLEKVKLIEMPFPQMQPALERGLIAAALVSEPFIAETREGTRVLAKAFDAVARAFYITGWFSTRSWLAANADIVRPLTQAIYETARWAATHHDETATILVKYTKLDPSRSRAMTRVAFTPSLDVRLIQPVLDVAYRYRQLDRPVAAGDIVLR